MVLIAEHRQVIAVIDVIHSFGSAEVHIFLMNDTKHAHKADIRIVANNSFNHVRFEAAPLW